MRVVQVLPNLSSGGVEKGTLEIAQALVNAGYESIVVSAGGSMVKTLTDQGSQHVQWDIGKKSPFTFRHIWAVRKWLKTVRPDIIHLRSRMPAWVMWLAWRGLPPNDRPHLVTTVHGLYSVSKYSEIMCKGERVIAVSQTVKNYINTNYPATDMSRVELIYRGVSPDEFPFNYTPSVPWQTQWQKQFPELSGKKILTLPGRLTRLKGHHDFISLMGKLKQSGANVHGLIVGGEDPKRKKYAQELYNKIRLEGLSDTITFTGNRTDIKEIFAISDVVLSLSVKPESFGRTVLEALSLGVPVVGYEHGGVGEVLEKTFPQGKVPLGNIEQLHSKVNKLLLLPALVPQTTLFTKQNMLATTLSLYKKLTNL